MRLPWHERPDRRVQRIPQHRPLLVPTGERGPADPDPAVWERPTPVTRHARSGLSSAAQPVAPDLCDGPAARTDPTKRVRAVPTGFLFTAAHTCSIMVPWSSF